MIRSRLLVSTSAILLFSLCTSVRPASAAICDGVSPATGISLRTVRITTGLSKPTYVTAPAGDTHRIFVLEQDGRIRIVKDGALLPVSFLDVDAITQSTGNEEGLLGLAFSPSYDTDGYFFIYHTENGGTINTVARYHVSGSPDLADSASRSVIIQIPHPTNSNHNGGNLQFGPDGMLWLGPGDGGSACDPPNNAQNTNEWKGKLLRIDVIPPLPVDAGKNYRVPVDNPGFTKNEIWSIGLRNPWRWSFDRLTHDLYIGDVGQDTWEEVDYRPYPGLGKGENFGWDHYEGLACPATGSNCTNPCAPINPRVDPVKVYSLAGSPCAVTGGYVYRGCRIPALAAAGRYFYADYCAANIESFVIHGGAVTDEQTFTPQFSPSIDGFSISLVTSWGEDARGEIYLTARGFSATTGEVYKVVPALSTLETSGLTAAPFKMTRVSPGVYDWSWEDLALESSHPLSFYRIYRSLGNGSGMFTCVFKTPTVGAGVRPSTVWSGGDPAVPAPGDVYSYVVTGVRSTPSFEETSPGRSTSGVLRTLSPASCP